MKNITKKVNLINYSRPLVASALVAGGLFQLVTPVLAQTNSGTNSSVGTIAPNTTGGTKISNEASATYEDDDGTPINATSNRVEVEVAEIAGVTVVQKGFTTPNGQTPSEVTPGDQLCFNFDITNVGNDPTRLFIPGTATVSDNVIFEKVQYQDPSSTTPTTWIDVSATNGQLTDNVNPGQKIPARVCVKVKDDATGTIKVQLGEPNGRTPSQNLDRTPDNKDVYTVDHVDGAVPGEVPGKPVNGTDGVKEAADIQEVTLGKPLQAFATVKKVDGGYNTNNTNAITDDSINYKLSLDVLNSDPSGNATATDLTGTTVNVNGSPTNAIVVSDAIPLGTQFDSIVNTPTGWTVVYTTDAANTDTSRADTANWTTTVPSNPATITRVGFALVNGRIAKGTSVTGLEFKVKVKSDVGNTVENIAQLFGTTPANPSDPKDKTPNPNKPVFDESGDNNPNNYGDDNKPGPKGPDGKPVVNPGIVDPNAPTGSPRNPDTVGKDPGNNTGKGPEGESNSVPVPTGNQGVLTGPKDKPEAVGPTDNNDDFTNKTTKVPEGVKKGEALNPDAVTFTNTIQNNSSRPQDLGVTPKDPNPGELPDGTKVTLKDPTKPNDPGVTFILEGGKWKPEDPTKPALILKDVQPGEKRDYTVTVDLPDGSKAVVGYPVRLTGFVDNNKDGKFDVTEPKNETIDRVYTGFIDLLKLSQIQEVVNGQLQPVTGPNGVLDEKSKVAAPGQVIHYVIKYNNISEEPAANSGSVGLTAKNLNIIEDGLKSPNNWGSNTTHFPGSANPEATTTFSGGSTNDNTDEAVKKYENKVTTLAPKANGEFKFSRKVK